jgi:hypothetical protein
MNTSPRPLRFALAGIVSTVIAAGMLLFAPVGAASAATATIISEHPTVASPIAGHQVTMQIYTGSLDGSYPAGSVDVMVEGIGMIVGGPANTSNGGTQINVGIFPIGTITVDAIFTPASTVYTPISTKVAVTISGDSDTIAPLFPTAPALGHPVTVSTILVIAAGNSHAPGGVVGFSVGGVSVGSCTPAATGAARNWSCSATLPAPTKAGPYTVTANFGRSSYYVPAAGSVTATVAAPPAHAPAPAPVKHAAAAPVVAPVPTATPTRSPTPTARPTSTATAAPMASGATTTDARTSVPTAIDPWALLFVGALLLLLAAGVVTLIVLRRRRATAAGTPAN